MTADELGMGSKLTMDELRAGIAALGWDRPHAGGRPSGKQSAVVEAPAAPVTVPQWAPPPSRVGVDDYTEYLRILLPRRRW
jgi:hypothetical protein